MTAILVRGVSASALLLALNSAAIAQQNLPTIDVGGARRPAATTRPAPGPAPTTSQGAAASGPADPAGEKGEPKNPTAGYVVRESSTAMKQDIPLKETPVTVNVVPKQVIRDQAITSLQGALENVPGVRSNNDDIGGYLYKIRGFNVYDTYRNQLNMGSANFFTDLANVERIEVLKGPGSIMYGRAEPGGIINIVTKQPLFTPRYVIEQQIGNYDHYRTQWDLTAPVSQVPGLAYRVSGAYQNSQVFRQGQHGERFIIAPVVTYQPSAWTEFTADLQYTSNTLNVLTGIPALPGAWAPANVPLSRTYQERNAPRGVTEAFVGSYLFRQNLNENWKVVNRFLYSSTWFHQNFIAPTGFDNEVTLSRMTQDQNIQGETYATNINLEGKFETFGAKHNFLFGLDYLNIYYDYYFGSGSTNYPINVFAPVYGTVPAFAYHDAMIGGGFKYHSSSLTRQKGMYVQDQVTFLDDRAHLLLGVRYDVADVTPGSASGDMTTSKQAAIDDRLRNRSRSDSAWSPRLGIVYDVTPEVSVYGSYSRSFGANNSTFGQTFPPQIGMQWEVGVKTQILPDLSANLAIFQLTKSNLTVTSFGTFAASLAGLQRSRGIELDITGRITDRLALIANYAHIDAKVIADTPTWEGGLYLNHLDNTPRHSGKIFATYDFGENGLGWRVGGGVTASTKAWGDITNTFLIPGFARLDAFASYATLYEGHKMTAQLNLNNITNTRYFNGTDIFFSAPVRTSAFPAQPFTVVGTLKFEW